MAALSVATEIIHHILGMAWKVGRGLVLGFAISGAIQAFISKSRIAEHLGKVTLRSVLLASGFGAASSSCSYAAASMSKSLYKKGAHIVTATAFLFASTNLVLEIGLIIWVLMGWRFVAAEFFGGMLLIGVVAVLLNWFAPKRVFDDARRHLTESEVHDHDHGGGETLPMRSIFTFKGVRAMARYFTMDFRMVGKDIEMDYFAWDYTTFLNLIILPLGAWLGWVGAKKGHDHHGMARS